MIARVSNSQPTSNAADDRAYAARISLLGHDLRSAVSDVLGGLRLIQTDRLDPAAALQLERVRAAGEELARLLEEGISVVAEHSGVNGPHPAPVHRLFHDIALRWEGRAQEKGVAFRMTIAGDLPPVLMLDRIALERVIGNFMGNAIKYADGGHVELCVAAPREGELRIEVRDDGPGFPPDVLGHLFEPGRRGAAAQDKPGHGLGMSISHEMAERLGGRIEIANRPDGGAAAILTLPARAPIAAPNGDAEATLPDLGRMRVLVAEDSKISQTVIGYMLSELGGDHDVADDGAEALDMFDRGVFDLAVIDIEMPRLSGLDLIRRIRASGGRRAQTPIVACTAFALSANRDAILAAGADAVVRKPILEMADLAAGLRAALDARGVAAPVLPHPGATGRTTPVFARLAGSPDAARILAEVRSDLEGVAEGLSRAIGAVDARPGAGPDLSAIRAEMHKLIAIAGAIGAEGLVRRAEALHDRASDGGANALRIEAAELIAQVRIRVRQLAARGDATTRQAAVRTGPQTESQTTGDAAGEGTPR